MIAQIRDNLDIDIDIDQLQDGWHHRLLIPEDEPLTPHSPINSSPTPRSGTDSAQDRF